MQARECNECTPVSSANKTWSFNIFDQTITDRTFFDQDQEIQMNKILESLLRRWGRINKKWGYINIQQMNSMSKERWLEKNCNVVMSTAVHSDSRLVQTTTSYLILAEKSRRRKTRSTLFCDCDKLNLYTVKLNKANKISWRTISLLPNVLCTEQLHWDEPGSWDEQRKTKVKFIITIGIFLKVTNWALGRTAKVSAEVLVRRVVVYVLVLVLLGRRPVSQAVSVTRRSHSAAEIRICNTQ